ncbi:MAG: dTMP kinase [Nitrospirae bacterium]|jgi:dTMP kinase|nr:dTMP kinase [Nitrospirota bacterium]MDA8150923.1 dTMP kinase [Nitrospiraceae bacterium]
MTSHSFPGRLVVVEGIDGSGKSTQIELLENYLRIKGFGVLRNAWNSSQEISPIIKKAKKKQLLTPYGFSLLHAADFSYRYTHEILPALNAGKIVLSDRYIYTAIARDAARGIPREWLVNNFRFAIRPDLTFFFRMDPAKAYDRITQVRDIKYYEAGLDMELSMSPRESYILFQSRVLEGYEALAKEHGFSVLDGAKPVEETQRFVRRLVNPLIQSLLQ